MNFSHNKLQDIVKKAKGTVVHKFEDNLGADELKVNYMYHFLAYLQDKSVENENKSLSVYILTNEDDQHLFDLWDILPGPTEIEKWRNLSKENIKIFEKRLDGLTAPGVEVKMVVELLITASGKAFFKLYETIFV